MGDQELQESDVFWPEQSHRREDRRYRSNFQDENEMVINNNNNNSFAAQQNSRQLRKKKSKRMSNSSSHSLPVNIPCCNDDNNNNQRNGSNNNNLLLMQHYSDSNESEDEDFVDAGMVPPHLIVAGRIAAAPGQMAFSVCTGNGRTLKGRDLSRVRNSILRMTGFLET